MWSRHVALLGEGAAASILVPARAEVPILRATFSDSRWELAVVQDLMLDGQGKEGQCGFVFGNNDAKSGDSFVGRVAFDRVAFRRLDRAILRPSGNIGVQIDQCTFAEIKIAIECRSYAAPKSEMHAGTMLVARSHFSNFDRAAILVENRVPGGQITLSDCVFEQANGFLLFVQNFNGAGPQPGIALNRCWIENVATGSNIVIDRRNYSKAWCIYARDCSSPIRVEDSPIGDIQLIATTVLTDNCALDALGVADLDAGSQLIHRDARQFSG